MTAVPTVTTDELQIMAANCPDLQILGINDHYGTFGTTQGGGFLNTLASPMTASQGDPRGWQKPSIEPIRKVDYIVYSGQTRAYTPGFIIFGRHNRPKMAKYCGHDDIADLLRMHRGKE